MPTLALSPVDVLLVIGLGAAGFAVVALVCVGVLAMLQLILPSTDAGAAAIDAGADTAPPQQPEEDPAGSGAAQLPAAADPPLDAEANA